MCCSSELKTPVSTNFVVLKFKNESNIFFLTEELVSRKKMLHLSFTDLIKNQCVQSLFATLICNKNNRYARRKNEHPKTNSHKCFFSLSLALLIILFG